MSNILVIDDDPGILEVVKVLLGNKGLQVKTESHWKKAFSENESFEPDVILMDIGLGNEDGRAITKQIKSSKATSKFFLPKYNASCIENLLKKIWIKITGPGS